MKTLRSIALLAIIFIFVTSDAPGQRRRPAAPRTATPAQVQPAPTFDNLLAANSYKVYFEIRGVGQLLRSPAFNDIVDPVLKVAGPPKEFKTLMKWLTAESDALMTSRMMFAAWPSRPKLPNVLFVIEFASPEEAQKFEPRLKAFLPKFLRAPTSENSPAPGQQANTGRSVGQNPPRTAQDGGYDAKPKEILPPYAVKQAGALVFITDVTFTFKNLRPTGSKLLTEDPNFRRIHDRFATESVLVYADTGAMEREEQERRRQMEAEEQKRAEAEASNPTKTEADDLQMTPPPPMPAQEPPSIPVSPAPDPDVVPQVQTEATSTIVRSDGDSGIPPPNQDTGGQAFGSLANLLFFGGRTTWPDALGVAVAFEPDSYAVRVLLINEPNARSTVIPFIPQLVSGPHITPESPSVLPADTEFFAALSLDYAQIYEGIVQTVSGESQRAGMSVPVRGSPPESPFAAYEKKFGFKVKDDLLPLLGNEIAISLPMKSLDVGPSTSVRESTSEESGATASLTKAPPEGPNPVVAIAIKDREAVRALIPKLIEALGLKGAELLAQTEKRGDTELITYANALGYAFIGNFVLVSPDAKTLRHVVDSYVSNETLGSESHFRNYTRWQPRQVLGQFYVSPALMNSYSAFARAMDSSITNQLGDLLSRISPSPEPVTYALSNEGLGPLHELRIPKNLALLMMASLFGVGNPPPTPAGNEAMAKSSLRTLASAEATYQATTGDGKYGSRDQLVGNGLVTKDLFEKYGYRIEVTASGSKFEATAVPLEYGNTGKLSFFIDESGVLRGGDHGGGPATVADNPVE